MSTLITPVVRIDAVEPNPNADRLEIWYGPQGPCQFAKGEFKSGDLVVFIPADSLVNTARPEFEFLAKQADGPTGRFPGWVRIRAMKLRGAPSIGLVIAAPPGLSEGADASSFLGVQKWEPPVWVQRQGAALGYNRLGPTPSGLGGLPAYDIENAWRFTRFAETYTREFSWLFTEKIHGVNFRAYIDDEGKLYIGSRTRWLSDDCYNKPGEYWHQVVLENQALFDELRAQYRGFIWYGEVFGPIQDLKYDSPLKPQIRFFDLYNVKRRWFEPFAFWRLAGDQNIEAKCAIPQVPLLTSWTGSLKGAIAKARELAAGKSELAPGQIREGVVVRPYNLDGSTDHQVKIVDEYVDKTGAPATRERFYRLIFKVISPDYLTRNNGTEHQE